MGSTVAATGFSVWSRFQQDTVYPAWAPHRQSATGMEQEHLYLFLLGPDSTCSSSWADCCRVSADIDFSFISSLGCPCPSCHFRRGISCWQLSLGSGFGPGFLLLTSLAQLCQRPYPVQGQCGMIGFQFSFTGRCIEHSLTFRITEISDVLKFQLIDHLNSQSCVVKRKI